jgi:DNA-directed RNA polymerase specialized sigma24 family protein
MSGFAATLPRPAGRTYHAEVDLDAMPPDDGWLSAADELAAYEGLREGDVRAFCAIAEPLQPLLTRLARLTAGPETAPQDVVLRGWDLALGGLDMFRWQTPLATWVAGITVGLGRSLGGTVPEPRLATPPVATSPTAGPASWSDLPWGPRWALAWPALHAAVDSLPPDCRETLYCRDVEGWAQRRTCDVLGVTEAACARLLADGHHRLRDALAALVTERARHDGQIDAVRRMLGESLDPAPVPLDPRAVRAFQRWHAGRRKGWQRLFGRVLEPLRA